MNPTINLNVNIFDLLRHLACTANREMQLDSFELRHLASATNREAQLDSCGLRHFARATLEAQLDSCGLRHFACATLEAQLDSCGLRHFACATLEAQLDSGGLRHLACAANSTRSDFLSWHSSQVWAFVESVISLGSSASCFGDKLYFTCFDERLLRSSASKSIRLVGSRFGSWLGSFVGLLIGCWKWIKWLTRTWFPATKLRLVNAFALLAERKIAISTENFKRATLYSFLFLQLLFNKFLNAVSFHFACVT